MTLAGLKKWWPMTSWGRDVEEAISSMLSVDVFEARIAPGRANLSISPKTSFFNAMFSNTASTMMSTASNPSQPVWGVIRASRCWTDSGVKRPRWTDRW